MTPSPQQRPLSPHLQIYRPQLTTMLSILHRITGAALAMGCLLIPLWLWCAVMGEDTYAQLQVLRVHPVVQFMMFGWLFSFVYHLLNGIRHLGWDMVLGFKIKTVYQTGWIVFLGTIVITLYLWFFL